MTLWESIVLGVIQGATEFLPVSSSGHLVMAQAVLDIEVAGVLFEVAVHVATLVSILFVYRERVGRLASGVLGREREALEYLGLLVVATIPAGLLGVFGGDAIEALFDAPVTAGVALLVTGVVLWSSRAALKGAKDDRPGWGGALLIGIAQMFALVPGISRSGSTVVASLWLGVAPKEAAAFSFLMAVPAIGGAALLQIPDLMEAGTSLSAAVLVGGGVAAALTGVLAIRTFVLMLARRSFHLFAPYCWLVGAAFLLYLRLR